MSDQIINFTKRSKRKGNIKITKEELEVVQEALDNLHLWSNCYKCSNFCKNYNIDVLGNYAILQEFIRKIETAVR